MQARLRWWLLGVLVLVIVSLLGVFEPIKFRARRDPDTGKVVAPIKKLGPVYLYKPALGLKLGLDLRGGMHLVLQAQNEAVFRYTAPALQQPMSEERSAELYTQIVNALPMYDLGTEKRTVDLDLNNAQVVIHTRAEDKAEMNRQAKKILPQLAKALPGVKQTEDPQLVEIDREKLGQIQEILSRRVDAFGVAEPIIQALPDQKRIIVELPGEKNPKKAQEIVKETAVLEFRWVPKKYAYGKHGPEQEPGRDYVFTDETGKEASAEKVLDESPVIVTGKDLKPNSSEVKTYVGQPTAVTFVLQGKARDTLKDFSRKHVSYYLAIVLDRKLIMVPIIKGVLPGEGVIEGGFDQPGGMEEAKELSILLNAGALPFDLEYVENRTVSPEYGKGALRASLFAGMIGLLVVLIFMVGYYRLPGLLADVALIVYIILLLGAIRLVNQVLTLPGILAVIISIGMAVDANIIIFERLKEEIRTGKTLRSATEAAFKRAWTAILDSNVCSIGTGIVLFMFGTGPIKGFAVALIIGVAVSLFTAVTVTRLFMTLVLDTKMAHNTALFGVSAKEIEG
jgi:protein-export membrane protein SecD